MHIHSIKIKNYKSFEDSDEIVFTRGINLIVGINNSGKTAVLEAMSGVFEKIGFRFSEEQSIALHTFHIDADTIRAQYKEDNGFLFPQIAGDAEPIKRLLRRGVSSGMRVRTQSTAKGGFNLVDYLIAGHDPIPANPNGDVAKFHATLTPDESDVKLNAIQNHVNQSAVSIVSRIKANIFFFKGERSNLGQCKTGTSTKLSSNASNLAEVINRTTASQASWKLYLTLIRRVLPDVKFVNSEIESNGELQVTIGTMDATLDTEHLRFPLRDCGTGVGQVLAILYVIATFREPSVIVIDEPTAFLHPAATRELLRIFKEYDRNQYFISTHAPEVFAEVRPQTFTLLRYENGRTLVESRTLAGLPEAYRELGISPFYNFTFWVEGETEVLALPVILQMNDAQVFKMQVSDVISRGSARREINRLVEIHNNMIAAAVGEPNEPEMVIVVDREHLTSADVTEYSKQNPPLVKFLPRLMFENYLLHAHAIAFVINQHLEEKVSPDDVQAFLDQRRGETEFSDWIVTVHGANLINEFFGLHNCELQKTKHSVEITKWIATNEPNFFSELREFLVELRGN